MIYILYQSSVFDVTAKMIQFSLKQQGIHSTLTQKVQDGNNFYIILGANDMDCALPEHYMIYQFEQVNTEGTHNWFEGEEGEKYIQILKNAMTVCDYSHLNCKLLEDKFNIHADFLPLNYNSSLDSDRPPNFTNTENGVLFMGSMNQRRREIFSSLLTPVNVQSSLWRKERDTVIRSSAIVLNVHYYPNATLETTRLVELLSQGAFIISEYSTDPILDAQFKDMVVFCDKEDLDDTVSMWLLDSSRRNQFRKQAYEKFHSTEFSFKLPYVANEFITAQTNEYDTIPEPDGLPFEEAETYLNDQKQQVLKLNKKPIKDDMPPVSVVTITHDREILFQLAVNNWRCFDYPEQNMEWIIVDDSPTDSLKQHIPKTNVKYIHIPSDKPLSIAEKRNIAVGEASNDIIVHMDDDDYYYPISLYARVKTLLTYETRGYHCVGCDKYAVYNILDDYSFQLNTNNLSEASMTYRKSFWNSQKFRDHDRGESIPFLKNRRKQVVTMPYGYVFIAVTHGKNITQSLRSLKGKHSNHVYKALDFETQRLFNRIYRQLERERSRVEEHNST